MTQDFLETETYVPQRPAFLKVLCILTFIGSSYFILSSTFSYFNANTISKTMISNKDRMDENQRKSKNNSDSTGFASKVIKNMAVMSDPDNLRKSAMGNIVVSILCLMGAILMWRLKKTGFYIYTLGTLIGIIIPFYIYGNNFLTALSGGIGAFIGVLFVIFYAMNLKSMR